MKRVSVLVLFSIFLYSCGSNTDSKPETISGVYKLKNIGATDQSGPQEIFHYKIYTGSNYFLATMQKDSSVQFGVGSYDVMNDTIIEHNFYDTENLGEKKEVKLVFSKSENGFSQEIPSMIKDATTASTKQEYDTISITGPTSNVDGLWQLGRTMTIKGMDTTYVNLTEFVIYQSGHYLKASRSAIDSVSNQYKNDLSFGTFSLNNNLYTENCKSSSDARFSGLTTTSSFLVNEKEGTMIQIRTDVPNGATEYRAYRKVK